MAAITRYDPFVGTSLALRDIMNRLFDEAFMAPRARWFTDGTFTTGVSLYETEDAYTVFVAVPGYKPKDLEVSVLGQELLIRGTSSWQAPQDAQAIWEGLETGQMEQRIRLPGEVDASAVEAQVQNGILSLRLPKAAHTRPQRITIKNA